MDSRKQTLEKLAALVLAVDRDHPVRVGIDGVDAAGKTMLAAELAAAIKVFGRPVIPASIDGFHNSREYRYCQGADSPSGYYQDSFNNQALLNNLLLPFGPGGNRFYRQSVYDYRMDAPTNMPKRKAARDAILLFDGIFLQRPELVNYWDYCIFVDVAFENSLSRGFERDFRNGADESKEAIISKYHHRYVPAQRLYFKEAEPRHRADCILDNNDINNPKLIIN